MEPLTTQTFSGDKTEEPQSAAAESGTTESGIVEAGTVESGIAESGIAEAGTAESGTVESGTADDNLAVPFRDFPISDEICRGLEAAGIFNTFPIQALTLPLALRGQDIIGQARTGTGKTLAFGIPLLQLVEDSTPGAPKALVVGPTRELALQVADDL